MSTNTTNVLSSGIEIIGSIRFQNDMHIDGKIDGEILSESGKVTIGHQERRHFQYGQQRNILQRIIKHIQQSPDCENFRQCEVII